MAASLVATRAAYVAGLQNVCKLLLQANDQMNNISALYNGAGLSGTFTDAELAANTSTNQLLGVDIGTFTANINTVQGTLTATSNAVLNNLAKCLGSPH